MGQLVFLSHSSKDKETVEQLCNYLEQNGKTCFIASRDIRSGREYAQEIINAIDHSGVVVLMLSEHANHSPHVLREIERAVSKSIPIFIYKMEEVELSKSMEYFLMAPQWMDGSQTRDFQKVLTAVNDILAKNQNESNLSDTASNQEGTPSAQKSGNAKKKRRKIPTAVVASMALLILAVVGMITWFSVFADHGQNKKNGQETGQQGLEENSKAPVKEIKVGDTVTFGSYYGEPIEWRVLRMSEEDGSAVLIAKQILCLKAYDAAESGKYNYDTDGNSYLAQESEADKDQELQVQVRGNGDWSTSNIRTWLNSADQVVKYQDQPPVADAMSEKKTGYQNEPGFLYNFTEDERAAIREVQNRTAGTKLSGKEEIFTDDLVYLLSSEELVWFEEAGINMLAEPTQKALEEDKTNWYYALSEVYSVREYFWWLRDPVKDCSSKCYLVGNGYLDENIFLRNVGLEGYGIRPAITVNTDFFQ